MTDAPYTIKSRPNLFDLAMMNGILQGGGATLPVQREAYWAPAQKESFEALSLHDISIKKEAVDD